MIDVTSINAWSEARARAAFLSCCGASRWAEAMTARRPFASEAELLESARDFWRGLERADWLEAFAAHPRIGDVASLRRKMGQAAAWSAGEQIGMQDAADGVLQALAEGNARYDDRFGHVFLVCATGKSAGELLSLLQARLPNDPETELRIAMEEQEKITQLRLQKLSP
jgi:OHCU decarboxylase